MNERGVKGQRDGESEGKVEGDASSSLRSYWSVGKGAAAAAGAGLPIDTSQTL